jgi:membrane protein DedA with SNARE-associated domain
VPRRGRETCRVSTHEIQQLLHEYGLGLVFAVTGLQAVGAPLPGTTVLIAAALYASTDHALPIIGVIAAGAGGALTGTSSGFLLGRWRGRRILDAVARRLRQTPERVNELRREFATHSGTWLFIGRFITGLRNVAGLVAGASGMPARRFLTFSAAAAIVWATFNSLEYYWFGRALAAADTWLQIVLVLVGLAWLVFSFRLLRRRARRRLDQAAGAETPAP